MRWKKNVLYPTALKKKPKKLKRKEKKQGVEHEMLESLREQKKVWQHSKRLFRDYSLHCSSALIKAYSRLVLCTE